MEFWDLVHKRRSVHNFEPGFKISAAQWEKLLQYVRLTPSGYNAQPWRFQLIQEDAALQALYPLCYEQDHILAAGNVVAVIGDVEFGVHEAPRITEEWQAHRGLSAEQTAALRASLVKERAEWKKREMTIRNCSLAAMTLLYAAEDLGLATCPMMGFRQLDLKRWLRLAEQELPILLVALGKAGEAEPSRLPRKAATEISRRAE